MTDESKQQAPGTAGGGIKITSSGEGNAATGAAGVPSTQRLVEHVDRQLLQIGRQADATLSTVERAAQGQLALIGMVCMLGLMVWLVHREIDGLRPALP